MQQCTSNHSQEKLLYCNERKKEMETPCRSQNSSLKLLSCCYYIGGNFCAVTLLASCHNFHPFFFSLFCCDCNLLTMKRSHHKYHHLKIYALVVVPISMSADFNESYIWHVRFFYNVGKRMLSTLLRVCRNSFLAIFSFYLLRGNRSSATLNLPFPFCTTTENKSIMWAKAFIYICSY